MLELKFKQTKKNFWEYSYLIDVLIYEYFCCNRLYLLSFKLLQNVILNK